jgi:hypothetical protein
MAPPVTSDLPLCIRVGKKGASQEGGDGLSCASGAPMLTTPLTSWATGAPGRSLAGQIEPTQIVTKDLTDTSLIGAQLTAELGGLVRKRPVITVRRVS